VIEKRDAPRRKCFLRAFVYFEGRGTAVDCIVRDISDIGARLQFDKPLVLNELLDLHIPIKGQSFHAEKRWHDGDHGPRAHMAQSTKRICRDCGFFLPLAGSLGAMFGVCGNEYAPDDGRVVSLDHGCGAHSEAMATGPVGTIAPVIDEVGYDLVDMPGVSMADTVFETLDHGES